jgi:hypothetical protein
MQKKFTSIWIVLRNTFISLTNGTMKWNLKRLVSMLLKLATIDPPHLSKCPTTPNMGSYIYYLCNVNLDNYLQEKIVWKLQ